VNDPGYDVIDLLQRRGDVIAVLVICLTAFLRGWVVTKREHLDVVRERDAWRAVALRGSKTGKEVVEVLKGMR